MLLASPPPQTALQERCELQLSSSWRDPPAHQRASMTSTNTHAVLGERVWGSALLERPCSQHMPLSKRQGKLLALKFRRAELLQPCRSPCPLPVLDALSFPFSAARAAFSSPRFGHCLFTPRDRPTGMSLGRKKKKNKPLFACI